MPEAESGDCGCDELREPPEVGLRVRIRLAPAASHHAISIVFTLVGVPDSLPE